MIPCLEGRPDGAPAGMARRSGVRCCPRCGVSCWRCGHAASGRRGRRCICIGEGEKQAAELLGIPFDEYSQGGLFPIAYTKGTDFRPAKRLPAEQFVHCDTW